MTAEELRTMLYRVPDDATVFVSPVLKAHISPADQVVYVKSVADIVVDIGNDGNITASRSANKVVLLYD